MANEENKTPTVDDTYINPDANPEADMSEDFDFLGAYDDEALHDDRLLPENTATSAIKCGFLGIGGGG